MSTTTDRKTLMGRSLVHSPQVEKILEGQPLESQAETRFDRQTGAVLFSDIVGSTAYFELHGDDAGMSMVDRHNRLLFPLVESHGGIIIKTIGDAIMASYASAKDAVRSAVQMQKKLKEHNASQEEAERISVRIGINFGTVIRRDNDLFGDVVNAAARVEALAVGGMILISAAVHGQLPPDADLPCLPFDAVRVKGKKEPVEVLEIRWDPDAPTASGLGPLPKTGDLLGDRFEILEVLGTGGMGQVFRARDKALDEIVALKFIHASLTSDPETVSRFKQEVKLARSVTHRNICRIHEFLQTDGHIFLSMERVEGKNLHEILQTHKLLGPERATEIVGGICAGLNEAHQRGITHRDLKPSNVMIEDSTGRVVIMDFGIALLTTTQRSTGPGLVIGTPEYMSPEQAQGNEVGPASDIYALGAILYELLTGRPPHLAKTPMAVALKHVSEEPARPRDLKPDIPPELEDIVLRCLAKDPAQRHANARELRLTLVGDPTTEILATVAPARFRLAIWMGVALALFLAVVLAVVMWPARGAPGFSGPQQIRPLVSTLQVEHSGRFSPDGKMFAFLKDRDAYSSNFQNIKQLEVTVAAQALDDWDLADVSWTNSNQIIFSRLHDGDVELVRTPALGGSPTPIMKNASSADVSPDGETMALAVAQDNGAMGIAVAELDGSGFKMLLSGDTSVSYLRPRWSPDGDRIVLVMHFAGYQSTRDIAVVDLGTAELAILTEDGRSERAHNADPTWSPNGEWIVYVSKRTGMSSLWAVPADGGSSVAITQGATEDQRGPDVSPDGSSILFSTAKRQMDIATLEPGGGPVAVTDDPWNDRFPVWSPDGNRIAFRSQRKREDPAQCLIILYDVPSRREVAEVSGPAGLREFGWCGSNALVYAATVGDDRQLGYLDLKENRSRLLASGFFRTWSPAADPACRQVVFSGQRTKSDPRRLFRIGLNDTAPQVLSQGPGRHTHPVFSPDGKFLAFRWSPSNERLAESTLKVISINHPSSNLRTVTSHPTFQRSRRRIRWSSSSRYLYYMEAVPTGGILWRVPFRGGRPKPVTELDDIHTFDFDLSPDGSTVLYPRATRDGDLFSLENVSW